MASSPDDLNFDSLFSLLGFKKLKMMKYLSCVSSTDDIVDTQLVIFSTLKSIFRGRVVVFILSIFSG